MSAAVASRVALTRAAQATPPAPAARSSLLLQRKCACGASTAAHAASCDKCAGKNALQAQLAIGASNDPLEREADGVADAVLASPGRPSLQAAPPQIQRFAGTPGAQAGTAPPSVASVLASPGRSLDAPLQQDMGRRFDHDFSRVRIHADTAAARSAHDVDAHAYTVGQNIVFGADRFAPGTGAGRRLLAHELTHVVQQTDAPAVLRRAEVANCRSLVSDETAIGEAAHLVVQNWCALQKPGCHREVTVPGGSSKGNGNVGYADMVIADPINSSVIEVGEIKPRSQVMNPKGYEQLLNYMEKLKLANPTKTVKPMEWTPAAPPNGVFPFLEQVPDAQFLGCAPNLMGMYFYECWRNEKPPEWVPVPVALPKEVLDKIRERLKNFVPDLDARTNPGRQPTPALVPATREISPVLAIALVVAVVIVLAVLFLPAVVEAVIAAVGAALVGLAVAAATLLGFISPAFASEGGGGFGGGDKAGGKPGGADGGGGNGGGTGAASGSSAAGPGAAGPGSTSQGSTGQGTPGKAGGSGKAGGGNAWDPLLDILKDPQGTALTPEEVARIKARLPQIIAMLRKAAANDPNAQDIIAALEALERGTPAGGAGGGTGTPSGAPSGQDPPGAPGVTRPGSGITPAAPGTGQPAGGKTGEGKAGGGGTGGAGTAPVKPKVKERSFGSFVPAAPASDEAESKGEKSFVYDSGLESLLLRNATAGTTFDVVISASIGSMQVTSRLPFTVQRKDGDQIVLASANAVRLIIQPPGTSAALVIVPGAILRYRPVDAPRPAAPKKAK